MGKIADAYVEIGANTSRFRSAIESLKDQAQSLFDRFTGIEGSGRLFGSLLASGFGKAIVALGAAAAAAAAFAVTLDQIYSRDKAQKFEDSIQGWTQGFRGLQEQVKFTDAKIAEIMGRDATGGNGGWLSISSWKALGERVIGLESMTSQVARNMNNAATASKLFADNLVRAAVAGQQQSDQKMGATFFAGLRKTAGQTEEERINAAAMKNVLDAQGGTRVAEQVLAFLKKNPDLIESGRAPIDQAQEMTGALARGDLATTKLFGDVFDIAGERVKVLAEEFDAATGAAEELQKIEEDRRNRDQKNLLAIGKMQEDLFAEVAKKADDAKKRQEEFLNGQIRQMDRQTKEASKLFVELPEKELEARQKLAEFEQARSDRMRDQFMFADLRTARDRLFTAAVDAKQDNLTASKMRDEISRVVEALGKLQAKWGMQ